MYVSQLMIIGFYINMSIVCRSHTTYGFFAARYAREWSKNDDVTIDRQNENKAQGTRLVYAFNSLSTVEYE